MLWIPNPTSPNTEHTRDYLWPQTCQWQMKTFTLKQDRRSDIWSCCWCQQYSGCANNTPNTLLSDAKLTAHSLSTSGCLMAPRKTPSDRRPSVSKQTCIPSPQTCLTSAGSWHHTNAYLLTATMQSSTCLIICHLKMYCFSGGGSVGTQLLVFLRL